VRAARGWVLIDWDSARPGSRLWDLAYAAQAMTGLRADRPLDQSAQRLRLLVDGYGLDSAGRAELASMLGRRAWAMHYLLRDAAFQGRQPWARIWEEDGPYWAATADHLTRHNDLWAHALR
jgi:thiamine kinase-like enzyme